MLFLKSKFRIYSLVTVSLFSSISTANASQVGYLEIFNKSNVARTIAVGHEYTRCIDLPALTETSKHYDKDKDGEIFPPYTIPAGKSIRVRYAKNGNCSGEQGYLSLIPLHDDKSPRQGILLDFDSDATMTTKYPKWMPGKVSFLYKDASTNNPVYRWEFNIPGVVVVAKKANPIISRSGKWVRFCTESANKCEITYGQQFEFSKELVKDWSEETERTVGASLTVTTEVGVETGPVSASTSVSASISASLRKAISRAEAESRGEVVTGGSDAACGIDNSETPTRVVFYWEKTVNIGNENVIMKSCDFACQFGTWEAPSWNPGQKVGSCAASNANKKVTTTSVKVVNSTIVPSQSKRIASKGANGEVTNFTLNNDLNMPISVVWLDGQAKDVVTSGGKLNSAHPWLSKGEVFRVENGAKTWQSHWFGIKNKSGFLCSFSPRQNVTVNLSELSACK